MSGFAFHIACRACALASSTYPFRYDHVVPTEVQLPSVDHEHRRFDRFSSPVDRELSADELAALAAANSTSTVTILVPSLRDEQLVLAPEAACPRCGTRALDARFGRAPTLIPSTSSLEDVLAMTRAAAPGEMVTVRFAAVPALLRCTRSDDGASFSWQVTRVDDGDIGAFVASLTQLLTARGSTCSTPSVARAYIEFDETTHNRP